MVQYALKGWANVLATLLCGGLEPLNSTSFNGFWGDVFAADACVEVGREEQGQQLDLFDRHINYSKDIRKALLSEPCMTSVT